jgi:hypothetical protein
MGGLEKALFHGSFCVFKRCTWMELVHDLPVKISGYVIPYSINFKRTFCLVRLPLPAVLSSALLIQPQMSFRSLCNRSLNLARTEFVIAY